MSYAISQISPMDRRAMDQVDRLLEREGIQRDDHLDYICGMYDDDYQVIATGSCFGSTLRCFAVDHAHQGEGLLNEIITHLMTVQAERGNLHLFLYTKPDTAKFFGDVGFYEIARVPDRLVFMENRKDGFPGYLASLEKTGNREGTNAAVVMNANPFTLGHQHLVETAAAACDTLHLFVVSEDMSLVPSSIRKMLVEKGTARLRNVQLHDCGPYMISSATFPSYFLKDRQTVIEAQARLDLAVFLRIAAALHITARFVGEEPASQVTGIYNRVMEEQLPKAGIACRVIPRKTAGGQVISASIARQALRQNDLETFRKMVPESTWAWFNSPDAAAVLRRIREAENVMHY
ncbi:MAG: [Clostridia bacterium]|nr:[citrate (pro-3S)-lyase] ligase [Clostridia bacterium]